jgi:hypothetical protein
MNNTTAYRYNDSQPDWMYAIAEAWASKTDAHETDREVLLKEWRLGSVKLVVEYDELIKVAVERGLIEAEDDYNSPK